MSGSALDHLPTLAAGERATVRTMQGDQPALARLSALGFSVGVEVQMLRNVRQHPMIVLVRRTRVALARDVAAGILMERQGHGLPQSAG